MHCKDCKHWGHPIKKYREPDGNECRLIDWVGSSFRRYNSIPINEIIMEVGVDDDSGLNVKITCGPLFGCVNFEKVDD